MFNNTSHHQHNQEGALARADVRSTREITREARLGLSMGHISPLGTCEFWLGGQGVKVQRPKYKYAGQYGGGDRGRISTFTVKSRRRLFAKLGRIKKDQLPIFLTLTYPADYPSASTSKHDLDRFWKRVTRRFPGASAIWKLEPQKRGAPHYHLLIWGIEYAHMIFWVKNAWYQVVKSGDERHLRAGTRLERLKSWRGALSYASKYIGKLPSQGDNWANPGRFWGVLGRAHLPWADLITASLTDQQAVKIIRLFRRLLHLKGRDYRSLTVNVGAAEFWFDRLDRLL